MYNVIIVDDEPVIRFGLKASVDWNQEGLHYLGDFSNGEEALKAMEGHTVDLLITDIKMPVMDGITLMKKALERFSNLKVILVSSYTDFQYVREGLKLGAVDYVLKPTLEPEEFVELIRKCVKKIDEEQVIENKIQLANKTKFLRERKSLEQVLKRVIFENTDLNELNWNVGFQQDSFLIITLSLKHINQIEEQFGVSYKTMILDDVHDYFYEKMDEGVCFPIGENEMFILLNTNLDPYNAIVKLKKELEQETGFHFSFGYQVISDVSFVQEGFEQSRLAVQRRFFDKKQDIFHYEKIDREKLQPFKLDQLQQFLLPYNKQKLTEFLQNRLHEWESKTFELVGIKKEACDIVSYLYKKQLDLEVLLGKCEQLKKAETLEQLKNTLFEQVDEADGWNKQKQILPQADNQVMTKALEYIHEHYRDELTLKMVASYVHISRNYFSVLFKRSIGQNFIDYVMDLRIKKAKELLENTSLKVYEVAERSGFNDVKYFSKLFKKLIGSSPVDFRNKHQH